MRDEGVKRRMEAVAPEDWLKQPRRGSRKGRSCSYAIQVSFCTTFSLSAPSTAAA